MRLERGDSFLPILLALAGVAAALWYAYTVVDGRGYARGKAEVTAQWEAANREAQEKADKERREHQDIVAAEIMKRQEAEVSAADYEWRWKEALNDARKRKAPLVACPKSTAVAAPGAPGVVAEPDPAADPHFTWKFVRLYDAAWTGADGKPLFGDPTAAAPAGADPAGPSPYGAGEVLDTHGENAWRADICRRDLNSLINTIERLQGKAPGSEN